ncbi:MAG: RagB/SusD family nutrient uptake outer membrane protein [Prevotella sp.]|nr:RagB/SusD family nutrient uptake outer membrane protein [Prevotella sp.]
MKKNTIYGVIMMLALVCSSCDDFLDKTPRGNAIADSADEYEAILNGSQNFNLLFFDQYYALWKSDDLIYTQGSLKTINSLGGFPSSIEDAIKYQDKIYRADESTPEFENIYNQIYMYNVVVNGVMDASGNEIEKKQLLAEARVSRAYMHFLTAQWYAMPYNEQTASTVKALPIIDKANTQQKDFEPATVEEYYQWIVKEMEEACPDLKQRTEHKMRCYKATGYALLGKVYFFMNKYDKALQHLRTAYDMLQGDEVVYLTDQNTKQKPYGYKELDLWSLMTFVPYPYRDNEVLFCKCGTSMRCWQLYSPGVEPTDYLKPEVYDLYTDKDLRRNYIVTKDISGNKLPYPSATFPGCMTNVGISLPEVYLMLAESEARVGSESNAREVLKALRSTRMLTGYEDIPASVQTKNDLIKFCFDEESREFAGTGYRFYTVRRLWNDPLFQDQKPISHFIDDQVFTMQEAQLKTDLPETILIWNEKMK